MLTVHVDNGFDHPSITYLSSTSTRGYPKGMTKAMRKKEKRIIAGKLKTKPLTW